MKKDKERANTGRGRWIAGWHCSPSCEKFGGAVLSGRFPSLPSILVCGGSFGAAWVFSSVWVSAATGGHWQWTRALKVSAWTLEIPH